MNTFTLYTDAECTLIAASGFFGEYRRIYGAPPIITTEAQNRIYPDGTTVRQYQIANYSQSTIYADEPTKIPLTVTPTDTEQLLYFTPTARIAFHCYGSIGDCRVGYFTFEYDFGDGFTWVAPTRSSNIGDIYKPKYIVLRIGTTAQYNNYGTIITIDKNAWLGIDLVYDDLQGRETTQRCVVAISDYELFLDKTSDTKPYKPKTGNARKGGTGQGYYPNNRIPSLPTNAINAAFSSVLGRGNGLTYYKLTAGSLSDITEFLYDCSLSLKFRNSQYRDAIASCVFIPYNVPVQVINTLGLVYLANKSIPVSGGCDIITEPLVEIDFGTISLVGDQIGFKSFADYIYTTATLYLPCFGSVNIDMHTLANGMLQLRAIIDCRNGNIMYRVETRGELDDYPVLYGQYNGNCGIPVPIGGANNGVSLLGAASAIGNVAVGFATGNPLNIVGGVNSLATQTAPTIDTAGALQPAGAALGTPVPVLQIKKKVLLQPPKWDEIVGRPSGGANADDKYTLGDFAGGFVRVSWCDVSGISNATDGEKLEIERLLKEGVWV